MDLDGVLADFDRQFEIVFNRRPNRNGPDPAGMWETMRKTGNFFETMPVMPNAYHLWFGLVALHPNPIILSGAPPEIPDAGEQKRAWVRKHFGLVNVITDKSKNKCLYAKPGDVLVDDWLKYADRWWQAGGVFIQYIGNVGDTLKQAAEALG